MPHSRVSCPGASLSLPNGPRVPPAVPHVERASHNRRDPEPSTNVKRLQRRGSGVLSESDSWRRGAGWALGIGTSFSGMSERKRCSPHVQELVGFGGNIRWRDAAHDAAFSDFHDVQSLRGCVADRRGNGQRQGRRNGVRG